MQGVLSYGFIAQDVLLYWDTEQTPTVPLQCQGNNVQQTVPQATKCYVLPLLCQTNYAQQSNHISETYGIAFRDAYGRCVQNMATHRFHGYSLEQWLEAGDSLSAWWTSLVYEKHPHMLPALYPMCKAYVITQLLEKAQEEGQEDLQLVLYFSDKKLQLILEEFCTQKKIAFIVYTTTAHSYEKKSPLLSLSSWVTLLKGDFLKRLWKRSFFFKDKCVCKSIYKKLPYILQSFFGFAYWLWRWRSIFFGTPSLAVTDGKTQATMVSYFPHIHADKAKEGLFRSQYYEDLHDVLQKSVADGKLQLHWLLIFVNSAQYNHKACMALKEYFNSTAQQKGRATKIAEDFHFVEEFLTGKDVLAALKRHIRLAWRSFRLETWMARQWRWGDVSFWPYMQEAWRESFRGWRGLERCLQRKAFLAYTKAVQAAFTDAKPKHAWTLFPFENCPWERMLTAAMHKEKSLGKVYAYQHSCVRAADFRYFDASALHRDASYSHFLPDTYVLNGLGAQEILKNYLPAEKIFLAEALRYRYLSAEDLPLLPAEKYFYLYIITSYFPQEVEAHICTLAQWYNRYGAEPIGQRWKIFIKAHPHCAVDFFLQKYDLDRAPITITQNPMAHIFYQISARQKKEGIGSLLWLSNSTTVTLEAAYTALPCMVQGPEDTFDMCPWPQAVQVYTAEDVQNFLQAPQRCSISKKYFYKNTRLLAWKALLGVGD